MGGLFGIRSIRRPAIGSRDLLPIVGKVLFQMGFVGGAGYFTGCVHPGTGAALGALIGLAAAVIFADEADQ